MSNDVQVIAPAELGVPGGVGGVELGLNDTKPAGVLLGPAAKARDRDRDGHGRHFPLGAKVLERSVVAMPGNIADAVPNKRRDRKGRVVEEGKSIARQQRRPSPSNVTPYPPPTHISAQREPWRTVGNRTQGTRSNLKAQTKKNTVIRLTRFSSSARERGRPEGARASEPTGAPRGRRAGGGQSTRK